MNNTKWNEIYQAFYYENELKANHPLIQWRTKDKENGYRLSVVHAEVNSVWAFFTLLTCLQ